MAESSRRFSSSSVTRITGTVWRSPDAANGGVVRHRPDVLCLDVEHIGPIGQVHGAKPRQGEQRRVSDALVQINAIEIGSGPCGLSVDGVEEADLISAVQATRAIFRPPGQVAPEVPPWEYPDTWCENGGIAIALRDSEPKWPEDGLPTVGASE